MDDEHYAVVDSKIGRRRTVGVRTTHDAGNLVNFFGEMGDGSVQEFGQGVVPLEESERRNTSTEGQRWEIDDEDDTVKGFQHATNHNWTPTYQVSKVNDGRRRRRKGKSPEPDNNRWWGSDGGGSFAPKEENEIPKRKRNKRKPIKKKELYKKENIVKVMNFLNEGLGLNEIARSMNFNLGEMVIFVYTSNIEFHHNEEKNGKILRERIERISIPNLRNDIEKNKVEIQNLLDIGCGINAISEIREVEKKEVELFIKLMCLKEPPKEENEQPGDWSNKKGDDDWKSNDSWSNFGERKGFVFNPVAIKEQKEKERKEGRKSKKKSGLKKKKSGKTKSRKKKKGNKIKKDDPSLVLSWKEFNFLWKDYKENKKK